jgi:hypothetical protein
VAISSRIPLGDIPRQEEDEHVTVGIMANLEYELEDDDAAYAPHEIAPPLVPPPAPRPWWKFW